jgi:hypothetical protein
MQWITSDHILQWNFVLDLYVFITWTSQVVVEVHIVVDVS